MNLLLLHESDFIDSHRVILRGRRHDHMRDVQRVSVGSELKAGILNGNTGNALVTEIAEDTTCLQVDLAKKPPEGLPLTLIVALPRPKMLKRILQTVATMGVKELILINSYRVEKSFWQTPFLNIEKIEGQLVLGLEQGVDTLMPKVTLEKRFKPFAEDCLPDLCTNKRALVAHPKNAISCPAPSREESVLVIGPEGGFIDYEIEKLNQAGCQTIHLGPRILRVETAVPALLSRLFPVF